MSDVQQALAEIGLIQQPRVIANLATLRDTIAALTAEVEALRRDAERYRFLREQHQSVGRSIHVRHACNDPFDDDLDAAIDAARQQEAGQTVKGGEG